MLLQMPTDKPKGKPGPKPQPNRVRASVTNIRSTPEWKAWLVEFADAQGTDIVDLMEEGMLMLAHKRGFKMPPPR